MHKRWRAFLRGNSKLTLVSPFVMLLASLRITPFPVLLLLAFLPFVIVLVFGNGRLTASSSGGLSEAMTEDEVRECIAPVSRFFEGVFSSVHGPFLEFSSWLNKPEHQDLGFSWRDVTFLRDFGPWSAGEVVPFLSFRIDDKFLSQGSRDDSYGESLKFCKIEFSPIAGSSWAKPAVRLGPDD
jgi:hypothetical protein